MKEREREERVCGGVMKKAVDSTGRGGARGGNGKSVEKEREESGVEREHSS
jgi:hypothetical protein